MKSCMSLTISPISRVEIHMHTHKSQRCCFRNDFLKLRFCSFRARGFLSYSMGQINSKAQNIVLLPVVSDLKGHCSLDTNGFLHTNSIEYRSVGRLAFSGLLDPLFTTVIHVGG